MTLLDWVRRNPDGLLARAGEALGLDHDLAYRRAQAYAARGDLALRRTTTGLRLRLPAPAAPTTHCGLCGGFSTTPCAHPTDHDLLGKL